MKHKILIIGSSGMLGVDLSQELRNDYKVIGADVIASPVLRHCEEALRPTKQSHKCDITNKREILQVVKNTRPDVVIHTAAWTDVDGCELDPKKAYRINSVGTKNVVLACKTTGAILIYVSTDFVFDGKRKNSYKETDKTNPLSIYADSKLKGELAIKRILKKYFILRTGWLYGKHGKNFVDIILKKARTEKILKVVDDQIGSPTYTKDLAKAIHAIVSVIARENRDCPKSVYLALNGTVPFFPKQSQKMESGVYHVSNSGSVSWYDYAKEILKLTGSRTKVVPISSKELDRPAKRPKMSVLDNSKFTKFTGHKMRNWQEALREYVVIATPHPANWVWGKQSQKRIEANHV